MVAVIPIEKGPLHKQQPLFYFFAILSNPVFLFQFLDGPVFQAGLDKVFRHFGKVGTFSRYDPVILGCKFFLNERPVRSVVDGQDGFIHAVGGDFSCAQGCGNGWMVIVLFKLDASLPGGWIEILGIVAVGGNQLGFDHGFHQGFGRGGTGGNPSYNRVVPDILFYSELRYD